MYYNPCWAGKIAITKDNKIHPCIFSGIVLGNIYDGYIYEIMEILKKQYWIITKDKINKCKDCEFRYVCFDCRELAFKNGNYLYGGNPNCTYNPLKGVWHDGNEIK